MYFLYYRLRKTKLHKFLESPFSETLGEALLKSPCQLFYHVFFMTLKVLQLGKLS